MRDKNKIILLALIILIIFIAPDIIYWGTIDHFQTPLRHIRGDSSFYTSYLNSVIRGKPAGSPFFWESSQPLSRFFVFGKIFSLIPHSGAIPIVWWLVILRGVVPVLVFLLLALILGEFGAPEDIKYYLSFAFVLFYGPMTFKGAYGLTFWFLPFVLLGIWAMVKIYRAEVISWKLFLFSLLGLMGFAVHPIAFAAGAAFGGIGWLVQLWKRFNKKNIIYTGIWGIGAVLLFVFLFLPYVSSSDQFSEIGKTVLYRNTLINTHFPFLFLFGTRYFLDVLIGAAAFIIVLRKHAIIWRNRYVCILVLSVVAFVGLDSYILTGTYVIQDHFAFLEDYIALALAVMFLFGPVFEGKKFKYIGWVLISVICVSTITLLYSSHFKPPYMGRWVPMFSAYLVIGFILAAPALKEKLFIRYGKYIIGFFVILAFVHAIFITYWDDRYWIPQYQGVQNFRSLISELNSLPEGVVLANPYIANLAMIYTGDKVYWTPIAFLDDGASTQELYDRWRDAKLLLPDEPGFNGVTAAKSIYGTHDNKCNEYKRATYLKFLSKIGITGPEKTICAEPAIDQLLDMILDFQQFSKEIKWQPEYRLDYFVLDKIHDFPGPRYKQYFSKIYEDSNFAVYKFIGSRISLNQ